MKIERSSREDWRLPETKEEVRNDWRLGTGSGLKSSDLVIHKIDVELSLFVLMYMCVKIIYIFLILKFSYTFKL